MERSLLLYITRNDFQTCKYNTTSSSISVSSTNYCRFISYKNNKNIFNKNEGRCRDVKTQKACKQGWEVNVGPKIKQTTSI